MNLKEWATLQGIHPQTAYKWFKAGTLPVPAQRVGPKLIIVNPEGPVPAATGGIGLYARVSSHDQKQDLERQMARLQAWADTTGMPVLRAESETASGMNGVRPKLRRLLADPRVKTIVVEHRDRLGRMNTELVESALEASGRRLVVMDPQELDDDLVRDMTEALTSFCARLYGPRSATHRAEAALKAAGAAPDTAEDAGVAQA